MLVARPQGDVTRFQAATTHLLAGLDRRTDGQRRASRRKALPKETLDKRSAAARARVDGNSLGSSTSRGSRLSADVSVFVAGLGIVVVVEFDLGCWAGRAQDAGRSVRHP